MESKIRLPLTEEQKLTPSLPDRYLPGLHTNKKVEAKRQDWLDRVKKLSKKETEEKIAAAQAEIDAAPILEDHLVIADEEEEIATTSPVKSTKSKSLFKKWFGRSDDENAQA